MYPGHLKLYGIQRIHFKKCESVSFPASVFHRTSFNTAQGVIRCVNDLAASHKSH